MALKQDSAHFGLRPKRGNNLEGVVLMRVCILGFFCPKLDQGFKPSAAHLNQNIGRVPPQRGIYRENIPHVNSSGLIVSSLTPLK